MPFLRAFHGCVTTAPQQQLPQQDKFVDERNTLESEEQVPVLLGSDMRGVERHGEALLVGDFGGLDVGFFI